MMAYIDIDKLTRKLRYIFKTYGVSEVITKKVNKALNDSVADVVEVVRCKDCKHRHKTAFRSYCMPVYGLKQITDLNAFCSYGERK